MDAAIDPDTVAVIEATRFAIEATRETVAQTERERERLRATVRENRKLREYWRSRFSAQAERGSMRSL